MRWTVVIPAKALPAAKSRLAPASPDPQAHQRLVEAIRADTTAAAREAGSVARVLVVSDRPGGSGVLVQRATGLNPALAEAAEHAAREWPGDGIAALVGDLPCLTAGELDDALAGAAAHTRSYVPDAEGTGTTLLAVRPGAALRPEFGSRSALRHAAGAVELEAGPGLRRDVDTADDLEAAIRLGVGPATAAALGVTLRSTCSGSIGT